MKKAAHNTIVLIPTFNESENILDLIAAVSRYPVDILIIDDNSPDGTARLVREEMKKRKNLHLLLRKKNRGRGAAGIAGFRKALERPYTCIIEMDADFSHNPDDIPRLISALDANAAVVLGSRLVAGGKDMGRRLHPMLITRIANLYIRALLGIKAKDCNSGFRCFRREVLENIRLCSMTSTGPDIVQEVLYRCHKKGYRIREIPITFINRRKGESKLTIPMILKSYFRMIAIRFRQ